MKHLRRLELLEEIATRLQASYTTSEINSLLRSLGITEGLEKMASSKRVYAREKLAALDDVQLIELAQELEIVVAEDSERAESSAASGSSRTVFVIHGRNERIRAELFSFLRAAGLDPLEWSEAVQLTGKGTPYIGEILDHAFDEVAAVIVLLTPDDIVRLSPHLTTVSDGSDERNDRLQPRPNVIFEAGMAFGRQPERTVLVSIGNPKEFSDVAGRHIIRLNNSAEKRMDLLGRLETAGCDVRSKDRRDWLRAGNFEMGDSDSTVPRGASASAADGELSEIELKILKIAAHSDGVSAEYVGPKLGISAVAAEHHLETLEEREILYARLSTHSAPVYVLDKKGRAIAVQQELV